MYDVQNMHTVGFAWPHKPPSGNDKNHVSSLIYMYTLKASYDHMYCRMH